jgi:hypothetical protein
VGGCLSSLHSVLIKATDSTLCVCLFNPQGAAPRHRRMTSKCLLCTWWTSQVCCIVSHLHCNNASRARVRRLVASVWPHVRGMAVALMS